MQEFDAEPADTEANPLQSVRLSCRVRSRKGECVWLKNRRVVGKCCTELYSQGDPFEYRIARCIRNAEHLSTMIIINAQMPIFIGSEIFLIILLICTRII